MKIKSFTVLIFSLLFYSCSSVNHKVEYNQQVDFLKYRTFNWLAANDNKSDKFQSLRIQKFQDKLVEVLAEKSLTFSNKPDILVAINIIQKDKVYYTSRYESYDSRFYPSYGFRTYSPEYYTESTILIALVEPETKKSVWEGTVKDAHYTDLSDERIDQVLRALFAEFPPTATAAYQEVK